MVDLRTIKPLGSTALSGAESVGTVGLAHGELGIDPGEAGEELLAEGGVGVEQLGGDGEEVE